MGADDETDWEALRRALADVKPLAKGPKRRARPSYERPVVREPSQTVAGDAESIPQGGETFVGHDRYGHSGAHLAQHFRLSFGSGLLKQL